MRVERLAFNVYVEASKLSMKTNGISMAHKSGTLAFALSTRSIWQGTCKMMCGG